MQLQMQKTMPRNAMIEKWGVAAVEKGGDGRPHRLNAVQSRFRFRCQPTRVPTPVVRNYEVFRPDAKVDTGRALGKALGDTGAKEALIRQIFTKTCDAFIVEAKSKDWKNNIAGGLTFSAMIVYHDSEEPR